MSNNAAPGTADSWPSQGPCFRGQTDLSTCWCMLACMMEAGKSGMSNMFMAGIAEFAAEMGKAVLLCATQKHRCKSC